ncbi:YbgA family protein [Spongiibacter pelagi]|uniref:YbgA family protein n=1 Tax=Spongiibacter pelagi TaxID=2760804 RepID=UPI00295BFA26|nr:DUF523 and DUF1722 domain-containing protein [Spongiibacter pelagi]
MSQHETPPAAIQIGISACLLGDLVRYDGGHKRFPFATDELSRHFEFIRVCPEQAIGLGVPRPTIQLVGDPDQPRVQGSKDKNIDVTDALAEFGRKTAAQLSYISGYIFCAKSPSCGMERVPVYADNGHSLGKVGVGAFARQIMEHNPLLPVEENGRLNDVLLRENFVLRVMAYSRWQQLQIEGISTKGLQDFHRRHKFLLLAHNQTIYRQLGPLVADAHQDIEQAAQQYITQFMTALAKPARPGDHCNAMQHIQGFLREHISSEDRQQLRRMIDDYAAGQLPLLAPLEMLHVMLQKYRVDYLLDQYYLNPYPKDLRLRVAL